MKTKNILLGILSLMTFATYAQTERIEEVEIKTAITELKVKIESLGELKNFDWKIIKEVFQENDKNQEITLAFVYENKSKIEKSKIRVDNFKMKLTGKTADLDKLTSRLKKTFEKLDKIDGRNI